MISAVAWEFRGEPQSHNSSNPCKHPPLYFRWVRTPKQYIIPSIYQVAISRLLFEFCNSGVTAWGPNGIFRNISQASSSTLSQHSHPSMSITSSPTYLRPQIKLLLGIFSSTVSPKLSISKICNIYRGNKVKGSYAEEWKEGTIIQASLQKPIICLKWHLERDTQKSFQKRSCVQKNDGRDSQQK